EDEVHAGLIGHFRGRVVVGRHHGDRPTLVPHLLQVEDGHGSCHRKESIPFRCLRDRSTPVACGVRRRSLAASTGRRAACYGEYINATLRVNVITRGVNYFCFPPRNEVDVRDSRGASASPGTPPSPFAARTPARTARSTARADIASIEGY